MRKLEKILAVIIVLALFMKFTLVAGGIFLTVISLTVLSLIYYPFGFAFFNNIRLRNIFKKSSYQGTSTLRIIGAIGVGMALSGVCIGVMFKLQHWSGAEFMLISGLIAMLLVLIIALIRFFRSKSDYYKKIVKRMVIIGSVGLLLALVPDLTIIKFQFRKHPAYIKAYENYVKDPQNPKMKNKLELEYNRATMSPEEFKWYMKLQQQQQNKTNKNHESV